MATFGERLKELRNMNNLTQKELAERIALSSRMVQFLEAGSREPNLDTIANLCDLFNVSADYLLGNDELDDDTAALLERFYEDFEKEFKKPMTPTMKDKVKKIFMLQNKKNKKDT